jgi:SNF2 family DNA or RNA helicase
MLDGKYAGIWIYGKQSEKFRQEQLKKFHDKKATFAIISMGCGGQGIDLVQSHCAFFIDLDWQPSLMLQAEDRLWRYGQKEKVEIFRMICNSTIDETIYDTVINKQEPLKILNGGNI